MSIQPSETTVVIPTFNESQNVGKLAEIILTLYPGISLLFVDDASPDGTAEIVRRLAQRNPGLSVLRRTNDQGFGPSYRDGFRLVLTQAACRTIVMMDADFSHNPEVIAALLRGLDRSDIVIGSRYVPGGGVAHWSWRRRVLSHFANFYVSRLLGLPLRDATSGFMAIRREALERIPLDRLTSDGYSFLVELKYSLYCSGARIAESPIIFDERREGHSKMSAGKIWESVWLPWTVRLKRRHLGARSSVVRPAGAPEA